MGPIATAMSIKKSALFATAWQRSSVCLQSPAEKPRDIKRRALHLTLSAPRVLALASAVLPYLFGRHAGLRLVASCLHGRTALRQAHFSLSPRFGCPRSGLRLHFNHPSANTALHLTPSRGLAACWRQVSWGYKGFPIFASDGTGLRRSRQRLMQESTI